MRLPGELWLKQQMLAPFGGHAVFPNIYRDMRQPWKYDTALNSAFAFTVSSAEQEYSGFNYTKALLSG